MSRCDSGSAEQLEALFESLPDLDVALPPAWTSPDPLQDFDSIEITDRCCDDMGDDSLLPLPMDWPALSGLDGDDAHSSPLASASAFPYAFANLPSSPALHHRRLHDDSTAASTRSGVAAALPR